jgi:hypothetical protein
MVLLTRRRWGWYFIPTILAATVLGGSLAVATGDLGNLGAPALLAFLWGLMWFSTPRQGMPDRRLSSNPDLVRLLCWGGLMFVLVLAVEVADCCLTGRAFGGPLEGYHIALFGPIVMVFLVGTLILARRIDRTVGQASTFSSGKHSTG